MTSSNRSRERPIVSREARSRESGLVPEAGGGEAPENGASPEGDGELDAIREAASVQGYGLTRHRRPARARAEMENGTVRITANISRPVRLSMEQARIELNLSYSQIVERALVHYFHSEGLRWEGLPGPGDLS